MIYFYLLDKTEEYPSPAEGSGLENRQGVYAPRGFESLLLRHFLQIKRIKFGDYIKSRCPRAAAFFFSPKKESPSRAF